MNEQMESRTPLAYWFLFGLATGSAVAMLFAPYSGPDVRRRLKGEYQNRKSRAEEWISSGGRRLRDHAQRVDAAFQAGRDVYKNSPNREAASV